MNRINPEKLLMSKWTSRNPQNGKKHFIVTSLLRDENEVVIACIMEAVLTRRSVQINWRDLKDSQMWQFGWK